MRRSRMARPSLESRLRPGPIVFEKGRSELALFKRSWLVITLGNNNKDQYSIHPDLGRILPHPRTGKGGVTNLKRPILRVYFTCNPAVVESQSGPDARDNLCRDAGSVLRFNTPC